MKKFCKNILLGFSDSQTSFVGSFRLAYTEVLGVFALLYLILGIVKYLAGGR